MKTIICLLLMSSLLGCKSSSDGEDGKSDADPTVLSGESNISNGDSAVEYGWFTDRRSVNCGEGPFQSMVMITISEKDACGIYTENPCEPLPAMKLIWFSVINMGPEDVPIVPDTYTLSEKVQRTGKNEFSLSVGGGFVHGDGTSTTDPGFDPRFDTTWSGSVVLEEVTETVVSGSIDLFDKKTMTSYVGPFKALKCAISQELQGDGCNAPPITPDECGP